MKQCLHCSQEFESLDWHCPRCGLQPERSGNLLVFAPELAHNSSGFKASYFGPLVALEVGHFWFRVRNALIIWALGKYGARVSSFMEIGCGTGFVLQGISRGFPKIRLVGSEIYPEGIAFAAERIAGGNSFRWMLGKSPLSLNLMPLGRSMYLNTLRRMRQHSSKCIAP